MTSAPGAWETPRLHDLASVVRGVTYKKSDSSATPREGCVPLLRATNISDRLDLTGELVYVPRKVVSPAQLLQENDIIVASSSGSASVVGKSAQLLRSWDGTFGAFCATVRPRDAIDPRYLALYLSSGAVRDAWSAAARGTNINNLKPSTIADTRVPLPPLDEQRRIVDILEDHLSRLDAAGTALGSAARRLVALEARALAETDDGESARLGELARVQGGIQKQPSRAPAANARPFLRVANVTAGGLDLRDVHQIEVFPGELDRYRLEAGDLLVVEGNGSASQIGRAALWDGSIVDCVHQNHLIRVRPGSLLLPEYLEMSWNSPRVRERLSQLASSSSGLHTLSVSKLSALELPVPSIERQRQLIADVNGVRESRRTLAAELDRAERRSATLRRALLSAAFSGRLTGRSSDLDLAEELIDA